MKKRIFISRIISFLYIILMVSCIYPISVFSQTQPGNVWIQPPQIITTPYTEVETDIHVNTGTRVIGFYDFEVYFDDSIISLDISRGDNGISIGDDGFVAAIDSDTPGLVKISGYDVIGKGPGSDLFFFTIHWLTHNVPGKSLLDVVINNLEDDESNPIGILPYALDGDVTVFEAEMGDVNISDEVDIVDALLVAQCYVGLTPSPFYPDVADFDQTGEIDIVDALLIARYYVDLITIKPTPSPTPIPQDYPTGNTPIPTIIPENWSEVMGFMQINDDQTRKCVENGFVVLSNLESNTLSQVYADISRAHEVPAFITTDALLHVFHITYAHMREYVEETKLYEIMSTILNSLDDAVMDEYAGIPPGYSHITNAVTTLWIYTAVARALINGEQRIEGTDVAPISLQVNNILDNIYACTIPRENSEEDYTHYEPRGHYLGDVELEHYYRAITWLERQRFYTGDELECTVSAILGYVLAKNEAKDDWETMRTFFVTLNNDGPGKNPMDIDAAMNRVFPGGSLPSYATEKYLMLEVSEYRAMLINDLDNPADPESCYTLFLDADYSLDMETLVKTVDADYVSGRDLPDSLDVAATVFHSLAAYEEHQPEMDDYQGLQAFIDSLVTEYGEKQEIEWTSSVYNYMLYTLRSLSEMPLGNVPEFMKNEVWEREKLNTQLAAWTELHNDNIIYPEPTETPEPTLEPTHETTQVPTPGYTAKPTPKITPVENLIVGQYKCGNPIIITNQLKPHFNIINDSDESIVLSNIKLHYYYTRDDDIPEEFHVDWAEIGASKITGMFFNEYVEIGFTNDAGILPAHGETSEIQVRINKIDWSPYNQLNDISFDATKDKYADWSRISIFYNGMQVWGDYPSITPSPTDTPEDTPTPQATAVPTSVPTITPTQVPTPSPLPQGYVEPYPVFYYRVKMMCDKVIRAMLAAEFNTVHIEKFGQIYGWADNFEIIATKILEDTTPLSTNELFSIKNWGYDVDYFFMDTNFVPESLAKSHLVTDIFNYEDLVLHEATGRLNPVIIFFEHPVDNTLMAGIGYIMSYYEFREQGYNRLNDTEWESILNNTNPQRPSWTSGFLEN